MSYLLALLLLVTATAATAQPARVIDGDTLELAGERIRLWGIDAVEGDQVCQRDGRTWHCGADAAAALEALVDRRDLTCVELDVDHYGRSVATCTVGDQDIGAATVWQGWALDFERYSRGAYVAQQTRPSRRNEGCGRGRSCHRGNGDGALDNRVVAG